MRRTGVISFAALLAVLSLVSGCGTQRKIHHAQEQERSVSIQLPERDFTFRQLEDTYQHREEIVVTDLEGNEVTLMETLVDEEGNEVAHETLQAAKVTARFRNTAERGGKVTIEFEIVVPQFLVDSRWQVRFTPDMYILEDTLALEPLLITGSGYREAQLRGYEHYNRFINSIITDSTQFVRIDALEVFLERNIPEVFRFRSDSSYVSEQVFYSYYGATQREAVEHYTRKWKVRSNDRKDMRRQRMYDRYVKDPIVYEGIKLDTVITGADGDIIYRYLQQFSTRPKLRKVDIVLSGAIYEYGRRLYTIPPTEKLTFYISSLNTFTRDIVRYRTRVIERRAEANTSADIAFRTGSWDIEEDMGDNGGELHKIRTMLDRLIANTEFDIDSIVVAASASPEGMRSENEKLSARRAGSVSGHFEQWVRQKQDSLAAEKGFSVDEDGNVIVEDDRVDIRFVSRGTGEDWETLDALVSEDTVMTAGQKEGYLALAGLDDVDVRERRMRDGSYYRYVRENLYPKLRKVRFSFCMHRKGMVKDTVHTTELDSVYMRGVQALRDMDYDTALEILRPYEDFNTAVAYCATGRNASALSILERGERDAQTNYMLAVIYSREDRLQEAVQCYMHACAQDPSYVHRGNLDPEISILIERYGLNRQDDIPTDFDF